MPIFEISFRDIGAEEKRGIDAVKEKKAIMLKFFPLTLFGKNDVDKLTYQYRLDTNELVVNAVFNDIKIPKKERIASLLDVIHKSLNITSSYDKDTARFKHIIITFYKDGEN